MNMHLMNPIAVWPTIVLVVAASITDLRSRRIPNLLVVAFLIPGILSSAIIHGWSGLGQSLLGVLLAIAALGLFCFLGGMGMGDLKLCAAVGAWIGPSQLVIALVMTSLIGVCWPWAGPSREAFSWKLCAALQAWCLGDGKGSPLPTRPRARCPMRRRLRWGPFSRF